MTYYKKDAIFLDEQPFPQYKENIVLKPDEKALLDVVLDYAGDIEDMIQGGITKALRGENEKARRTYLWNILSKAARERIRRARQKVAA